MQATEALLTRRGEATEVLHPLRPEEGDTAAATVAAVAVLLVLAAASTLTERQSTTTKTHTPRGLWNHHLQAPRGKSFDKVKVWQLEQRGSGL
jgi:hypothetical protein